MKDIDVRTNYVFKFYRKKLVVCNNNVTVTKDVDSLLIQAGEEIGLENQGPNLNQLATPSKYPSGGLRLWCL